MKHPTLFAKLYDVALYELKNRSKENNLLEMKTGHHYRIGVF